MFDTPHHHLKCAKFFAEIFHGSLESELGLCSKMTTEVSHGGGYRQFQSFLEASVQQSLREISMGFYFLAGTVTA